MTQETPYGSPVMTDDLTFLPPPPILRRHNAQSPGCIDDVITVDPQMTTRYLQYEVKYSDLKKEHKGITWGQLILDDYHHFVYLMSHSVAKDSNTFMALKSELKPDDLEFSWHTVRSRDTEEGKKAIRDRYLELKCSHKGAMNGKTWRQIRAEKYSYFMWSVGNSMGRETKSFDVLVQCLNPADQITVRTTGKGEVIVPRSKTFLGPM
jgi:hypothetical protein